MQKERPLSPHLQVYRWQITMMLSIMHRGTGVFLAVSTPVLVYWLWSISVGGDSYQDLQACFGSVFGRLALLAWAFSMFYHLCNGIRHLFWDVGQGYEIKSLYTSGKLVVVIAFLLTAVTAYLAIRQAGGA
ncbi:MAG: succinate dehydrogenase, cytochrome b556 subunit [Acidiferrobacterales bacterium]|nr:succinate dehydrogenase, cytochrome b556 subunit [Acidiferrobacterales bacterium]